MHETVPAAALRESEELHRITLINMSDAVFITNDDGVFTFVCPNVDIIFGYGQDEVQAMSRISILLGGELFARAQLEEQGEIRNIEHEVTTKSGMRRVLLVHISRRKRIAYETEFRIVGYDDIERWVIGKGRALRNGKPLRM